ncbi:hypothetical protein FOA43_002339 [Brettanomyces nanus]|uniref:Phosphatidic acid phosphatase type 2/haloperoxidase domain-containing protein n=1 Tax=Eeniella nana TaxID=13502 RepID=A0A875S5G6_EENNA|nr:uncharacterized protein FOA43_002339 [Brettanomyces nanus]QPG74999.1 hypothetical protein FOA43_002339 [Brettanomyces nanus]
MPLDQPPDFKELANTSDMDAGLKPESFYKARMNPIRFRIRHVLVRLVLSESPSLAAIQQNLRCKVLDYYFLYSANLGAHMFYVLMCPLPAWLGHTDILRDSVQILGWGIFMTGCVKDFLCLPRPISPPLKRLTLSHYTAQEYGCPSSHTANATSVCLLILRLVWINWSENTPFFNYIVTFLTVFYLSTMVLGRIYCGMHGYIDLAIGALVGIVVFVLRLWLIGDQWDHWVLDTSSRLVPVTTTLIYYTLVYLHSVPLDACPCNEDSVSFMGVLMGLDAIHWLVANYAQAYTPIGYRPEEIPFYYEKLGPVKTILRLIFGVSTVVLWKTVSKPVLMKLFGAKKQYIEKGHIVGYASKPRTDPEIFVRLIVYAGIPTMVVLQKFLFPLVGLE